MGLLNFLVGGGTTKQETTYRPSAQELELYNLLKPYLGFGTAFGETQLGARPFIADFLRRTRAQAAPYGGGAELQAGLQAQSRIGDIMTSGALQRQQGIQGILASLVSGRGTQMSTMQQPTNLMGLGNIIGLLLTGGMKMPNLGGMDSFFGTGQNPSQFGLNYTKPTYPY